MRVIGYAVAETVKMLVFGFLRKAIVKLRLQTFLFMGLPNTLKWKILLKINPLRQTFSTFSAHEVDYGLCGGKNRKIVAFPVFEKNIVQLRSQTFLLLIYYGTH